MEPALPQTLFRMTDAAVLGKFTDKEGRTLKLAKAKMTSYLLKRREDPSPVLARFVERAQRIV